MNKYKIIFAGTPVFAAAALEALFNAGYPVVAVYTQPDRPAGRGQKLIASLVKEFALKHQLPLYQPLTLRDENVQEQLRQHQADVMIVAAYGLILPKAVLEMPKLGCLNIHASLLPHWRGAAPIQRAIEKGDTKTGITIMQMDEGLDTGAMLYKKECAIEATDTSQTLLDKLTDLGAQAILTTLNQLAQGIVKRELQDNQQATYAHKITKEEAKIDWNLPAVELERQIRAFNPWPVSFTTLDQQTIRIWAARAQKIKNISAHPGTIIQVTSQSIDVMTGDNVLSLQVIQLSGGKALPVSEILHAKKTLFTVGQLFK